MIFIFRYLYCKWIPACDERTKYSSWVLSFLLLLFSQASLFPTSTLAHSRCSVVFQSDIKPEQLKNRLLLIAQNKIEEIQALDIDTSVPYSLSFRSTTGIQFQIKKDSSLTEPEIELSPSAKILKIPSHDWLRDSSSNNVIQRWLVGHEIHPYTSPSKTIQYTEAQNTAFKAFKQALIENVKSFLHIAPTSAGKTLVMAKALKEKLQNHRTNKISFVTAHQIRLVDQLFDAIQQELQGTDVTVINWNNRLNKDFYLEVERSTARKHPTVFVITSQSLKQQLNLLQHKNLKVYSRLTENTDGIYIDEAHHLGAFHTKEALLALQEKSGAFLYGSTATPVHHEVNLRDFFEKEHWSYLNTIEKGNLFVSHPPEKVMEQLSLGIEKGEITPFDKLHIIGESKKFNVTKEQPLFIQSENYLRVLNPHHYNTLAGMLHPIIQPNKKGFIVTATIAEALRLTEFLNEAIEGITFEAYHSNMSREQRQEVEKHSKQRGSHYIVAVRALDEGINLPHLSAYIDLNVNVSVKQMVHRIGRVLRLHPGKTEADILFLADYRNEEMAKDLLQLLDVVNVLNFHSGIKYNRTSGDSSLKSSEVVPLTRKELQELKEELEQFARNFWNSQKRKKLPFNEVTETFKRKNIISGPQFKKQRETDPELENIPKHLYTAYKEWKGWKHFREQIGKGKPPFNEVTETFRRKNITSDPQFKKERETDPELQNIPKNLNNAYKEWKGWKHFREQIGKGKPPFNEVKETFRRKNIMWEHEYEAQRKTDPELQNIPSNLKVSYKEWKGWRHFRGETPRIKKREKPPLNEIEEIFRRKNITSGPQFKKQRETDLELQKIPSNLEASYKGWKGWKHFRGEKPQVKKSERPSYNEAIEVLQRKNITHEGEYNTQRGTDPDLQYFPKQMYAYKEWKGWPHFRGEKPPIKSKRPPYNEATEILQRKSITHEGEYNTQRGTDPDLQHFPKQMDSYKEWKGWRHFRGEKLVKKDEKPPYEELIETLRRKNIMWEHEYKAQRETDPELQNIPKTINKRAYPEWKGWPHFREQIGKGKPPLNEVKETFRRKNITSDPQFKKERETDPELQNIPKNLNNAYKEWKGWKHFRGEKPLVKKSERLPYNEVTETLRRKNITSGPQLKEQKKTDPELRVIPRDISTEYKEWKGWHHFRGETPPVKKDKKPPYNELIETLRRKNITSGPQLKEQKKTDPELAHFLKIIDNRSYPEWKGWRHFRKQLKTETNE